MEPTQVDGLEVLGRIGRGGCGRVYLAKSADGELCAVKVFDETATACELLARMTSRLAAGGWPAGVMRVFRADFHERPVRWVTGFAGDFSDGGVLQSWSLQHRLDQHPGAGTWDLVRSIAVALAQMHRRQVAHGNLKPGNVFVTEDGKVRLADWAMGNMAGVPQLVFTDAVLYQPPEQLRDPAGYLEEAGYRWDVFAFGVLAFRLLTGRFPRCEETFSAVAPAAGEEVREGIHADLQRVAGNLEVYPDWEWPDAPANELEKRSRDSIDGCLQLDPARRPASMVEVSAAFDFAAAEVAAEVEREELRDDLQQAERRVSQVGVAAVVAAVLAVGTAGLWVFRAPADPVAPADAGGEIVAALQQKLDAAAASAVGADERARQAEQQLVFEKVVADQRMEKLLSTGDRLFGWALEADHRRLPALDGRVVRLGKLERDFEEFLAGVPEGRVWDDERARLRLQLAEISLAAGDPKAAGPRLVAAEEAWAELPEDADLQLRIARNKLLLALLLQSADDRVAADAFAAARRALEEIQQAEVDADRLSQLLAVLDFNEAKTLAASGDEPQALAQLMRATRTLNRLADQRPDAAVLRSELAACYQSSATILEGIGKAGDARELRSLAATELVALLKESPDDPRLRLELAGCYGAMAEAAVMSGDVAAGVSHSRQAMELLDRLLAEEPGNVDAVVRKAAQLGLLGGIHRDSGQSSAALKELEEGIRLLESVRPAARDDNGVAFRLAILWWQKGRMIGMGGDRGGEVELLRQSLDLLEQVESRRATEGPGPKVLKGSRAYLLGDLGHALELSGRNDEAAGVFTEAVALWEELAQSRPESDEYDEGLAWCRQRLKELQ